MKLKFDHVSKNYGLISALNDISLDIKTGEFVFIVGPSGAGKSTLIKLILNQIKPTSGTILLGDTDVTKSTKREIDQTRRKIGVIFQDYQLIPDKTIEENIALALDIVSYPKDKISNKVDEVIKKVNLGSRRFLFPSQLSGGEMQRAALARALAVEPQIILADEPTGNLDIENTWNLIKLLKTINDQSHTTIIMTTHNLDIIDSLKKRTIFLRNGSVEKEINNKSSHKSL
ncbi:MAG TPA: ATP-binding cassette domain-containing protein [Patescibacteria group bacterium]